MPTSAVTEIDGRAGSGGGQCVVIRSSRPPGQLVLKEDAIMVGSREGAGRCVVARESLAPGQLVLQEDAFMVGPRLSCLLVCVECLARMDQLVTCTRCGFPVCSTCQSSGSQLAQHGPECDLLSSNGLKLNLVNMSQAKIALSAVSVLRLLLMDGWTHLESHSSQRAKNTKQCEFLQKHIVPVILNLRDHHGNILFTKDIIEHAAGVLDTNSFEIKTKGKGGKTQIFGRSLFIKAALFNNSCEPNCYRNLNNKTIQIYTTRAVCAGDELSICYADLLQPTAIRQEIFARTKHFQCSCERCRDPTERGSFLTSLKCMFCRGVVHQSSCENCGETMAQELQLNIHEKCSQLMQTKNWGDCTAVLQLMNKLREVLTDHHHILIQVKRRFLIHAGECKNCRMSPEYLTSCMEMTGVINKFLPGHKVDWSKGESVK